MQLLWFYYSEGSLDKGCTFPGLCHRSKVGSEANSGKGGWVFRAQSNVGVARYIDADHLEAPVCSLCSLCARKRCRLSIWLLCYRELCSDTFCMARDPCHVCALLYSQITLQARRQTPRFYQGWALSRRPEVAELYWQYVAQLQIHPVFSVIKQG